MPLSANFRREMIEAMKNAKKKKEKEDSENAGSVTPTNTLNEDNTSRANTDQTKPLSMTRSVNIKDNQGEDKVLEKTKSHH